jgi:hypothetical protein
MQGVGPDDAEHVRQPGEIVCNVITITGAADPRLATMLIASSVTSRCSRTRPHVAEEGDAHAAAGRAVVDEAQEAAAELPAAVCGHDRRMIVRDLPEGLRRDIKWDSPVPGPGPPGAPVPARGQAGPGEHLRPGDAARLP